MGCTWYTWYKTGPRRAQLSSEGSDDDRPVCVLDINADGADVFTGVVLKRSDDRSTAVL